MLHKAAVDASALELLKGLQSKQYLKGFFLAGGTALALYNGHRRSVDIDLFSDFSFSPEVMLENLSQDFEFNLLYSAPNTIVGVVNGIKTDIIAHRYKLLKDPVAEEECYLLSEEDIIAMKLNAICTSGQRIKDFVDIYFLLKKYDLKEMIDYFLQKYDQASDFLVVKSLIYFDNADVSEWPVLLKEKNLKWKDVKSKINKTVINYSKSRT